MSPSTTLQLIVFVLILWGIIHSIRRRQRRNYLRYLRLKGSSYRDLNKLDNPMTSTAPLPRKDHQNIVSNYRDGCPHLKVGKFCATCGKPAAECGSSYPVNFRMS